jgi:hypothetical protein
MASPPGGIPRYSRQPLPGERHLPGRTPRPREAAGSGGVGRDRKEKEEWAESEAFLRGTDLWNHAFFWEAHEAWEEIWRAVGRRTRAGCFLQGLILLAAAAVKREIGAAGPASRLAARGARRLREAGVVRAPFDAPGFAEAVEAWVRGTRADPPPLRLERS